MDKKELYSIMPQLKQIYKFLKMKKHKVNYCKENINFILQKVDIDFDSISRKPKYEHKSWKVILRKEPIQDYFITALDKCKASGIKKRNNIKLHAGHLIAEKFDKYLLTTEEIKLHRQKVYNFFGVSNSYNVSLQKKMPI